MNPKSKKELAKIKAVLKAEKIDFVEEIHDEDWWNEISDAEKKSLEKGIEQADAGKLNPHSKARAIYGKRL